MSLSEKKQESLTMVQLCSIPRSSNLPHGTRPVHFSEQCHDLVAIRQFTPGFLECLELDHRKNIRNTEKKKLLP